VARYVDIHPVNPQGRLIDQVVALLRDDGLIAYPTDSGYALGIQLGNRAGLDRMRTIRHLDDKHHFTLVCHDFSQLGPLVHIDNAIFRLVKASTPGPYTFILPATSEVPRRLMHEKKRTVGVRIPEHTLVQSLLGALGEPLISTTLLLPGETEPMTEGWQIQDELGQLLDAVIEGEAGSLPTTVVDLSSGVAEVMRYGAGDASRFE
jgi:tRNA threonylcarbamoyl adenosine modification protein (Sua5/YciO/YrdC/YwlC family)